MTHVLSRLIAALTLAFGLWGAAAAPASAEGPVRTANVEAELHASKSAVAPGETMTIVLRQKLREGWHTYWRNYGDSGDVTRVAWTAPTGVRIGEMRFPTPKTIPVTPLMTYGYEGEVLYPFDVTIPRNARSGEPLIFAAAVSSVVCSDVCVIEEQALTLRMPVAARSAEDPVWGPKAAAAIAAIPRPAQGVSARITRSGETAMLTVAGGPMEGLRPKAAYFFPMDGDVIQHAAPQSPSAGPNGMSFRLTPAATDTLGQQALAGVLRVDQADGQTLAIEINAEPGAALPGVSGAWTAPASANSARTADEASMTSPEVTGLAMAALFAFLGGLILNVMPCVFPVLSMKALGLSKTAHTGAARRQGVLFFAGVMTTFLALALLLMALKAAGAEIGWGFQLQEPLAAAALALIFFALGLNLLGVFEVGAGVQNLGSGLAARQDDLGAFFTGALSVVAASPCTAPFMGGALGFAATAAPLEGLVVFAALGAGFAAPFTALAFAPALLRRLPKPGPWMDVFKQVMAFPMFAAAIWLAWVVAVGVGANGALAVMGAALSLGFVIWAFNALKGPIGRSLAMAVAAAALAASASLLVTPGVTASASVTPGAWSVERVESLRAEGKPVFVNFTAAWCISCKVNELNALDRPAVQAGMARAGVVYLKGDWTRRDAAIAQELARYGRDGVPLYLYFAPGAERAVVLPQLLSEDAVLSVLAGRGAQTASAR